MRANAAGERPVARVTVVNDSSELLDKTCEDHQSRPPEDRTDTLVDLPRGIIAVR